jgi:hypothetical protein
MSRSILLCRGYNEHISEGADDNRRGIEKRVIFQFFFDRLYGWIVIFLHCFGGWDESGAKDGEIGPLVRPGAGKRFFCALPGIPGALRPAPRLNALYQITGIPPVPFKTSTTYSTMDSQP